MEGKMIFFFVKFCILLNHVDRLENYINDFGQNGKIIVPECMSKYENILLF